eukprot:1453765-Alexandrium_andersonii.AAC.1
MHSSSTTTAQAYITSRGSQAKVAKADNGSKAEGEVMHPSPRTACNTYPYGTDKCAVQHVHTNIHCRTRPWRVYEEHRTNTTHASAMSHTHDTTML